MGGGFPTRPFSVPTQAVTLIVAMIINGVEVCSIIPGTSLVEPAVDTVVIRHKSRVPKKSIFNV